VFAVKNRQALIDPTWDEELYKYITGIAQTKGQKMLAINGVRDHIHIFIGIKPNCNLSDLVREVKKSSNAFIKENKFTPYKFEWQEGFGAFSDLQSVENVRFIELKTAIPNAQNYFACKVIGESMNKIIPNGSICLFEKYSGGSRNGLITLVEMTDFIDTDFGSNYSSKEYSSKKTISEDNWKHEEITLLPMSTLSYDSIVLRDEETINLKVIGIFVKVLG